MPSTWGIKPNLQANQYQKFLGLKNLGNTCYMNSILQQLFMIPTFRYNLLSIEPPNLNEQKGIEKDDVVLARLQEMFANMELSEKNVFEMESWCQAFKQRNDDN